MKRKGKNNEDEEQVKLWPRVDKASASLRKGRLREWHPSKFYLMDKIGQGFICLSCFVILSAISWIKIRGLWKLPDGRDLLWGNLGLILMGGAMLSKSLIKFSVDGRGCDSSL